jgi:phospholipid/cholesterol/gamma-HCH transport system substrate-binding protein
MSRRVNLNLLVFGIGFAVMSVWLASNVVSFKQVEQPFKVTADFDNGFGVLAHAEVAYIGVPFGQVTAVKRINDGVRITMAIERGRKIPRGSTANIQRKSAIGEQFIDFYPPKTPDPQGGVLKGGDHIPRNQTTVPLEFSELLRSASALLDALEPGDVGTIIHEAAVGLEGRADSLRQLAVAGDTLTSTIASRTEALDRISANGGRLTRVFAEHRGALGDTLDNLAALNATLAASKGDIATLLDKGGPLLEQVAGLVAKHKTELDCDLKVLEVVIDHTTTPEVVAGLRALLTWAPAAFAGIWDTRDVEAEGVWVRVGFITAPADNPPKQFAEPRPLPPVVPAPSCDSTIAPSVASYSTSSAHRPPPIDTQGASIGFGLALVTAAVVLRSAIKTAS